MAIAPLVLASSSPRRLALLRQVLIVPDLVMAPSVDETPGARELPRAYALRMAEAKAAAVAAVLDQPAWVVAADTVVACGRRILPKAETVAIARACLVLLSGRRHRVVGGVALRTPDGRQGSRLVETVVRMKRLSTAEREAYLEGGEWQGKAGGYAIQGAAAALIPSINGSYSNVVGLPLAEVCAMLSGLGWQGRTA